MAVTGHLAGERFVLLDGTPVALDPALVNSAPATTVVAAGRGDAEPVTSAIALQGITLRPLSPVHPRVRTLPGGLIEARWTRRARGSWLWLDGVDAPLKEQSEQYQVTFGPVTAPLTVWVVTEPLLTISAALKAQLVATLPGGELHVCQQGSYGLSQPLFLATLS